MHDTREQRFPPRDRVWLGINNVQLISTAEPVDLDALKARMASLALAEPRLRFFSRAGAQYPDRHVDAATPAQALAACAGLVQPLSNPLNDAVGSAGPGDRDGPLDLTAVADSAAALLEADRGLPVPAVFAGHGVIGQRFPHVFGDGLSALAHLRRLATGPEPQSKVAPFPITGLDRPLDVALRARYRYAPRRFLDDVRSARPAPRTSAPQLPGGERPQSVQVLYRQIGLDAMNELKAYRKRHSSGVSTMAMVAAALRRGLAREELIPSDDGMFIAFDLRSYLPRNGRTGGNFISVSYLQPADPLSGASIDESVKEALSSGRPLLALAAGSARVAARRHTPLRTIRGPATGRDVAVSHMRISTTLPVKLLAAEGTTPLVLAASTPSSHGSISYTLLETGGQLSVTAVFCSPFTPREPMARILDDLAASPVTLLG